MIFSTINRTQKKVSADLVSSLFGLDTTDTPQKTALQVVLRLNGHPKSPFFKRIKLYGGDYSKSTSPPLSQATMVRSIVSLISENLREAENDRYRKRKELLIRSDSSSKHLPFRTFYATDKDYIISDILYYFFISVRETFKRIDNTSFWELNGGNRPDNILQTSVGYEALLRILVDILTLENIELHNLSSSTFDSFLEKANKINLMDQEKFPFSTKGKNILYTTMCLKIWPNLQSDPNNKRKEYLDLLLQKD